MLRCEQVLEDCAMMTFADSIMSLINFTIYSVIIVHIILKFIIIFLCINKIDHIIYKKLKLQNRIYLYTNFQLTLFIAFSCAFGQVCSSSSSSSTHIDIRYLYQATKPYSI